MRLQFPTGAWFRYGRITGPIAEVALVIARTIEICSAATDVNGRGGVPTCKLAGSSSAVLSRAIGSR